jgi:hypothetical protein
MLSCRNRCEAGHWGTTLILRSNDNEEQSVFAITDAQGHFQFDKVEPGSYSLEALHMRQALVSLFKRISEWSAASQRKDYEKAVSRCVWRVCVSTQLTSSSP